MTETNTNGDTDVMLLGRFDCPPAKITEIDAWIPKHLDDSLANPGLSAAAYFHVVNGLPAMFAGPGNRACVYVAVGMAGIMEWMDSPELSGAVEDSGDREEQFYPLDGESPGTANIYESTTPSTAQTATPEGFVMLERFEVGSEYEDEFDAWLAEKHGVFTASLPGVLRSQIYNAKRDTPDRSPYHRYRSIGNRMLLTEFRSDVDVPSLFEMDEVLGAFTEAARWDLRLPYVRREVYECVLTRKGGS